MKDEKIREVPTESVTGPTNPIRSRYDENALNGLADSIRNMGVLNPLIVRRHKEGYEVIAGHRRLVAARMAELVTVPVVVRELSGFGIGAVRLHENLNREDIDPADEAQFFSGLLSEYQIGVEELALKVRRSVTYVRNRLKILEWDSAIREAVSIRKIPFSAAYWLNKIEPEGKRRDYLRYAISGGITTIMAKAWYVESEKGRLPSEPDEKILESIPVPERKDYYKVSCEICGEVISLGEQGVFMAHQGCIDDVKEAVTKASEASRNEKEALENEGLDRGAEEKAS